MRRNSYPDKLIRSLYAFVLVTFYVAMSISFSAHANTLTDVGTGAIPDFDPRGYDPTSTFPAWRLSSSCVDINESGQAACQALAVGPVVKCGFRNKKRCTTKVSHVYLWNGSSLERISDVNARGDTPNVMNNAGEIGGYEFQGAVYGNNNGRIWHDAQNIESTPVQVISINDRGDYILRYLRVSGGISHYTGVVKFADGTEVSYPGSTLVPYVVANNGEAIGNQIIQAFLREEQTADGIEVTSVQGSGWFIDQAAVDALPKNATGNIDDDPNAPLWPLYYYGSYVTDANDFGDFSVINNPGRLHSSTYCSHEGETRIIDKKGIEQILPWSCFNSSYVGGSFAGGKAFAGVNNHGDIVGSFTPPIYGGYTNNVPRSPWVWLVNASGGLDEYNANDLLPPGSGYIITTVSDINDRRQIIGSCVNPDGASRGCILSLTDIPVPADTTAPMVRIDTDFTAPVTDVVTIEATAYDKRSKIRKVKFQLGETLLNEATSRPFSAQWDSGTVAPGTYTLKVTAIDGAGNRNSESIDVIVGGIVTPPTTTPPTPTTPVPTGTDVEGEGTILAIGVDYLDSEIGRIFYNADTVIKLNDVSAFAVGQPLQYKGVQDSNGTITALKLEAN